jgi:hypothetical protein
MRRPFRLLGASATLFLVVAASASASSISLTAEPVKPTAANDWKFEQLITVNTVVDSNSGLVSVYGYDLRTPCPATPGAGPATYGTQFTAFQGSSTTKIQAMVNGSSRDASHIHLCGWLSDPGSTTVADFGPLRTWSDVAGWNVEAVLFWKGGGTREYWSFEPSCGAGTTGLGDRECPLAGRVRVRVSSKLRKTLKLESATILDRAFSWEAGQPHEMKWQPPKGFNAKAIELRSLPVTMTVTWTAPIATTFTATGDIRSGKCGGQVWGASYPRKICGTAGATDEEG